MTEVQDLKEVVPWEQLPMLGKRMITRLGDSAWGVYTYTYGYVVGIISEELEHKDTGKRFHKVTSPKYANSVASLVEIINNNLPYRLDGEPADTLRDALNNHVRVLDIAQDLRNHMKGTKHVS